MIPLANFIWQSACLAAEIALAEANDWSAWYIGCTVFVAALWLWAFAWLVLDL